MTERFLQGFGEVRAVQTTISHTYENDVLKPAREMAGLYAIIEGAIGRRDALLLPVARKVTRGIHREPRRRQCLLSVARLRCRRRSAPEHHHGRADHSGDDRPRGEQSAAHGADRAGAARRRVPRWTEDAGRAVRDADQPAEDGDRRQPGRHDRGDQQALRADDAARAAGAGKLRPYAGRHLSERRAGRGDLPDPDRRASAC